MGESKKERLKRLERKIETLEKLVFTWARNQGIGRQMGEKSNE